MASNATERAGALRSSASASRAAGSPKRWARTCAPASSTRGSAAGRSRCRSPGRRAPRLSWQAPVPLPRPDAYEQGPAREHRRLRRCAAGRRATACARGRVGLGARRPRAGPAPTGSAAATKAARMPPASESRTSGSRRRAAPDREGRGDVAGQRAEGDQRDRRRRRSAPARPRRRRGSARRRPARRRSSSRACRP